MKDRVKKNFIILTVSIAAGVLCTTFNSCDVYSENNLFKELESHCLDTNDCVNESTDFLELKINTENNYPVKSDVSQFDIGGECNEGGFAQNAILWELYLDGTMIQSSQAQALGTTCLNGRFVTRVVLPRIGLLDTSVPAVRREHRLDVEILGIDENGETYRNLLMARKSITLTPVTNSL